MNIEVEVLPIGMEVNALEYTGMSENGVADWFLQKDEIYSIKVGDLKKEL